MRGREEAAVNLRSSNAAESERETRAVPLGLRGQKLARRGGPRDVSPSLPARSTRPASLWGSLRYRTVLAPA